MTNSSPASLDKAVQLLKRGGGVIYPTETCWGFGVRADSKAAIEYLLEVKGRSHNQPVSLMIPEVSWLDRLGVFVSEEHNKLIRSFWPGPLTLLFEVEADSVYRHLASPLLGVRCTSHPLAGRLIKALDVPLTSPSANFTGQPLISDEAELKKIFEPKDIIVLHEENIDSQMCESTVMKLEQGSPIIIREGVISEAEILKALDKRY